MPTIRLFSASADAYFHHLFRGVMAAGPDISLSDDMDPAGHLLSLAQDLVPDVYLLDWKFRCRDGTPLLDTIQTISPTTKTLLFCDVCGKEELAVALAHGARGLLFKTSPPQQWLKAVRTVSNGGLWFGRELLIDLLDSLLSRPEIQPSKVQATEALTEREKEVAGWVGRGMSNKEIARQMTISDATVKTHLQHIFSKLKVDRRMRIPHQPSPSWSARLPMPF